MSDSGFVSHCLELLSPLGRTSSRRMFGGRALYIDDLCMALIFGDSLYLKVDDVSRTAFERAGCSPFVYVTKDGEHQMLSYYTAPEEAMESPAEMVPWARRGLAAAIAARAKAPPAKKKTSTATAKKTAVKVAPAKKVAAKKASVKKAAASKVAPRQVAVNKAPVKMAAAKKVAATKVVGKKAAASKTAAKKAATP